MTSNEIKKIIDVLNKPEETNIFYDIKEITKLMDTYLVNNWMENKSKYKDEKLIAILAPKKFWAVDVAYFLTRGVVINGNYISYDEIIVVGKCDFFHNKSIKNDYVICYGDEQLVNFPKNQKTTRFACDVIEKIIEEENELHDSNEKIKYYLDLCNRFEDKDPEIILYKKIIQMTQDPNLIGNLVKKFGYLEYLFKYSESKKKRNLEKFKSFPLVYLETMTIFLKKKADKTIADQYRKMYENILSDCSPYLKLLQDCNQLQGYEAYVSIYYTILAYASLIQKKISDELIYKFNSVINELRNKIENNVIETPQGDNFYFLSMIKYISDIYSGKIIVYPKSSKKVYKYTYLKNTDKAHYWLNLYVNQAGSDNTVEYEDVMFSLANIYKYGTGNIEADEKQMLEYLKTAANHGCIKASKFLAEYYIEKNNEEKDKWIQLAKDNGQKIKDKRSINEKLKESVGIDITEAAEAIESITGIGNNIAGMVHSLRDTIETVGGIATDTKNAKADKKEAENRAKEADRNAERGILEHEQYLDGQKVENKRAKAKNMKAERKADKAIAKEDKKRR